MRVNWGIAVLGLVVMVLIDARSARVLALNNNTMLGSDALNAASGLVGRSR